MRKIGIGLYGGNGHQLSQKDLEAANVELKGLSGLSIEAFSTEVTRYDSLEDLLSDETIELISICAPMRNQQGEDIRKALLAGKHVYVEKPCVTTVEEWDELFQLANEKNLILCEMAGSIYEPPYSMARQIVESGELGEIVQIFAQKSYPYADWRPQDENVDGGLLLQNAVYGFRFVEQVAMQEIVEMQPLETTFGNPKNGGLRMACSIQLRLKTGGIATVIANYLNQPGTGVWGNEELRIFGTKGYLSTNIRDSSVEVYNGDGCRRIEAVPQKSLFQILAECISEGKPLPVKQEYLAHPTRSAIIAKGKL